MDDLTEKPLLSRTEVEDTRLLSLAHFICGLKVKSLRDRRKTFFKLDYRNNFTFLYIHAWFAIAAIDLKLKNIQEALWNWFEQFKQIRTDLRFLNPI